MTTKSEKTFEHLFSCIFTVKQHWRDHFPLIRTPLSHKLLLLLSTLIIKGLWRQSRGVPRLNLLKVSIFVKPYWHDYFPLIRSPLFHKLLLLSSIPDYDDKVEECPDLICWKCLFLWSRTDMIIFHLLDPPCFTNFYCYRLFRIMTTKPRSAQT